MRTITKNLYQFEELSEEAKQKAVTTLYDINVGHHWWDCTYEDAANIGLKITGFGLDRDRHAEGEFILSACEVAQNIFNNHGETCDTFKTATDFMQNWQPVFNEYMDENSGHYESHDHEQTMLELEAEFLKYLLEDYSIILQNESEYLMSDEAIIETIHANEYEFDEDGNRA